MTTTRSHPNEVQNVIDYLVEASAAVRETKTVSAVEELCGATRLAFHELYDFWLENDGEEVYEEARIAILQHLDEALQEIANIEANPSLTSDDMKMLGEHVDSIRFRRMLFEILFTKGDTAVHQILRDKLLAAPV